MTSDEERRHYDQQIGMLQVTCARMEATLVSLRDSLAEFKTNQRDYNEAVIDRLDNKVNGALERHASFISTHGAAIATLLSEISNLKTPITLPTPLPGTKTTVEVSDLDERPLTRRDLKIVVVTLTIIGGAWGFFFKFWPAIKAALDSKP